MSKYWVKFRWTDLESCWQEPVSCFVTTGEGEESSGGMPHELLEVTKL